ncbi:HR-like lesion-inducer [Dillenia turbinata]|uniref:HR-like lesion-inducer n=1 Tax=Dillenia turbinata TaxID=194707 RepID=A0AAN8ZDK6_9MAGN
MGFISFLGRLLFASLFILSAWQIYTSQISFAWEKMQFDSTSCVRLSSSSCLVLMYPSFLRFNDFGIDGGMAAKEFKFKFDIVDKYLTSKLGLTLPQIDARHLVVTCIALKGIGGFLFVFGNLFGAFLLLLSASPPLFALYKTDFRSPDFYTSLDENLPKLALFGALLFFVGMKNSLTRRQPKKKSPKLKAS